MHSFSSPGSSCVFRSFSPATGEATFPHQPSPGKQSTNKWQQTGVLYTSYSKFFDGLKLGHSVLLAFPFIKSLKYYQTGRLLPTFFPRRVVNRWKNMCITPCETWIWNWMIGNKNVGLINNWRSGHYFNQLSYPDSHYLKINESFISAG